jgi:AcrR family transcriptional regulator
VSEPARRRLLRSPERAASILAAAACVFARSGYEATSMDEVAAEAGISKLIVYRHFNSKHDLYVAVLRHTADRIAEAKREAPSNPLEGGDPVGDVTEHLLATLRAARESPDGFRLLFFHAAREPEFAEHARQFTASQVAQAEQMLSTIQDPLLRRWAARLVSGAMVEGLLAWLDAGDPDRDPELARRLALAMAGIVGSLNWL